MEYARKNNKQNGTNMCFTIYCNEYEIWWILYQNIVTDKFFSQFGLATRTKLNNQLEFLS